VLKRTTLTAAVTLLVLSSLAHAQDQSAGLQKKLDGLFTLTKLTADHTDIVTPGSILVLHKEGLLMCSTQAQLAIKNVYKGGRLAPSRAAWNFEMGIVQSDTPTATIPTRQFVPGEKFWVTAITTDKSGVVLKIYSDPYDDIRYFGQIEIPYNKKAMPSDDELLKSLAEVVTVDAGQDAAQPAPQAAADSQPAPVVLPAGVAPSSTPTTAAAPTQVEDPITTIRAKLDALFILTKGNVQTQEITKAGSIIELRKDGLVMWSTDTKVTPIYVYKDGKLSMPFTLGASLDAQFRQKQPDVNRFTAPKRTFVAGEKFWILGSKVSATGVILLFVSDPYQDVRYYGEIWFPFDKKQPVPQPDAFMKTLAEVISVGPPPEEAAKPEPTPTAPTQPPAPTQAAVAPIAAPPAPPKVVTVGQSREEVAAILGQPTKVAVIGPKEIDYYPDMKVIFIKGKVTDIQ
jgi:hypothetical protein